MIEMPFKRAAIIGAGLILFPVLIFLLSREANYTKVKTEEALRQIQQQNAEQFKRMEAHIGDLQQDRQRLADENASLQRRIATRQAVIEQQQKQLEQRLLAVQSLPLPSVAGRWIELTRIPTGEIQTAPNNSGLLVSDLAARHTLESLERLPAAQQEVKSLQADKADLLQQLKNEHKVSGDWQEQVSVLLDKQQKLEDQHAAELKVVKAEMAVVKAKARRSKLRWGVIGTTVGFILKAAVLR